MDTRFQNKAPNPRRRRNMEASGSTLQDSGCQFESGVQEDKLSQLMAENASLREQLQNAQHKQHMNHRSHVAAERKATELKTQLDKARYDLLNAENKVAAFELKLDMAKQKIKQLSAKTTAKVSTADQYIQTEEKDTSELILQLQTAHEVLEKCTLNLQSSEDLKEDNKQEHHQKVQALKTGILSLGVKLQQEQAALIKKATKTLSCTSKEEGTSQEKQSAQAEEVEKVNFHLQKLQIDLLNQALTLKTVCKEKNAPNKYQWVRTQQEQEVQTDKLDDTAESQGGAAVQKDLQRIKEEAQVQLEKSRATFTAELESLKQVNAKLASAQKKAEGQLRLRQKEWQEERSSLLDAIQLLPKTLKEKAEKWTERESHMAYRMDELESKMEEMLEKKVEKKRGWLRRIFTCSSSK